MSVENGFVLLMGVQALITAGTTVITTTRDLNVRAPQDLRSAYEIPYLRMEFVKLRTAQSP
jgi:hypothetical protein